MAVRVKSGKWCLVRRPRLFRQPCLVRQPRTTSPVPPHPTRPAAAASAPGQPRTASRRARPGLLSVAPLLLFTLAACGGDDPIDRLREEHPNRRFVTAAWDTVFQLGSADPNDTTLLTPGNILLWDDRIVLTDGRNRNVRVFSRSGELLWVLDKRGQGPGELAWVTALSVSSAGHLWVPDQSNGRILELTKTGELLRELRIQHLPASPQSIAVLQDRVVFPTQTAEYALIVADPDSLRVLSWRGFPWPEPLDSRLNLDVVHTARRPPSGEAWAMAFSYGPGFMVFHGDSVATYRYIDPIPFAIKSGPRERAMGADSARYAALSISQVGDELFMLFGSRPRRQQHPAGEPTLLIDVYGLDGQYRRSYKLPSNTIDMTTEDGETFYVLTYIDETYPVLLGLRPPVR